MSPARALQTTLRFLLALLLGFGPLGLSVLAEGLHATLCECEGCDSSEGAASCCDPLPVEDAGPALGSGIGCPCRLALPTEASQPLEPRLCEARSHARVELEHSQRAVEFAVDVAPLPTRHDAAACAVPRAAEPGLAGSRRSCGAVRAAALGARLL